MRSLFSRSGEPAGHVRRTLAAVASLDTATALIDRLVHHADILAIEGDSYRRREAESATKSRRSRRSVALP